MNRKDYQTPTMKVVQLQHQCHILAGSQVESVGAAESVGMQDYNLNDEVEE